MIKKGKEYREQELLDLYPDELIEEIMENEKQKKKIIESIKNHSNNRKRSII